MKIIRSEIFDSIPQITFGLSTRTIPSLNDPFGFNLSFSVGNEKELVTMNRERFFTALDLREDQVAYHYQIHSDIINCVDKAGYVGESDALITNNFGLGLVITTADCSAIFIFDRVNKVIAAVHSGWRGTSQKILEKTLISLRTKFNSSANDLIVFMAPSISQKNYEVGEEVALQFDKKFLLEHERKVYLDVASANYDMLLDFGIPSTQIERSDLCSYGNEFLHSYRRDGHKSGRALGIIAMKSKL